MISKINDNTPSLPVLSYFSKCEGRSNPKSHARNFLFKCVFEHSNSKVLESIKANNVDIIVFEADKGDCMQAVWTTLSVGRLK